MSGSRSSQRVGVLVIRAWLEGDPPPGLRARITLVTDVADPEEQEVLAASEDEVLETVRGWLRELETAAAGP